MARSAQAAAGTKGQMQQLDESMQQCLVCLDMKPAEDFGRHRPMSGPFHDFSTCHTCIVTFVKLRYDDSISNEIHCPECPHSLDIQDIQTYLDVGRFAK